MTWLPFISIGAGGVIGQLFKKTKVLQLVSPFMDGTLVLLMLVIGASIGSNDHIMKELSVIGFQCGVLAFLGIACSVVVVVFVEYFLLSLHFVAADKKLVEGLQNDEGKRFVWLMPSCIIAGIVIGYLLREYSVVDWVSPLLKVALVCLYISVGISVSEHKEVIQYIKKLGLRVVWFSVAIICGSVVAGYLGSIILKLPLSIGLMATSGMSYYSVTGIFMTAAYGIKAGTYGFLVNVMREFFTLLLLPILIKISKGSPMAGGASGNMDTMLGPVTKFVGPEAGMVALITGTILTFVVPVLLPVIHQLIL